MVPLWLHLLLFLQLPFNARKRHLKAPWPMALGLFILFKRVDWLLPSPLQANLPE
jgi:hypothetical protein